MLRKLFKKLFISDDELDKLLTQKQSKPNLKESRSKKPVPKKTNELSLKTGEKLPVLLPDFRGIENLKVTTWHYQIGDVIKAGEVIATIENESIMLEFEVIAEGRILSMCSKNIRLKSGDELCVIEGI